LILWSFLLFIGYFRKKYEKTFTIEAAN
jgi:hypothetical protein